MPDTDTSTAAELQKAEHAFRDDELLRNHKNSIALEYYRRRSQRIERMIYFVSAVPIAAITLTEFQLFPKLVFMLALLFSFFAYLFWYVLEFHDLAWRLKRAYEAVKDYDGPSASKYAEDLENFRKRHPKYAPDKASICNGQILMALLIMSFFTSLFGFADQYTDMLGLPTPSSVHFVWAFIAAAGALLTVFILHFRKILNIADLA